MPLCPQAAYHSASRARLCAHIQRLNALYNTLQGDMETVAEIRSNITKEPKNAEVAVRYTERLAANVPLISQQNLALPPQYSARFPLSLIELESAVSPNRNRSLLARPRVRRYFRELLGTFEKRMEQYRHVLHEILQLRENEPKTYTPQSA